jgi:hypothetical protein
MLQDRSPLLAAGDVQEDAAIERQFLSALAEIRASRELAPVAQLAGSRAACGNVFCCGPWAVPWPAGDPAVPVWLSAWRREEEIRRRRR